MSIYTYDVNVKINHDYRQLTQYVYNPLDVVFGTVDWDWEEFEVLIFENNSGGITVKYPYKNKHINREFIIQHGKTLTSRWETPVKKHFKTTNMLKSYLEKLLSNNCKVRFKNAD